ncbi:OLC1v1009271C1 [Oldenlandia corymbosa var. corymbosa]|uniref:OLC1v1009271C1 n=1 Tax=Oldenlandia corymbosa var. corymbosa TaxID=529605 RepID=A0AAV1DNS2_OLDCO|nr:OLC1v1009271C1 [Oldenlandia corymbosa var. corymbosa]
MLNRDKLKATAAAMEMDPDAAKELSMKQEFKRAEERMGLVHKNNSKWAKCILKRSLDVQDEGTRAAISEQLYQHAILTRKINSLKDSSDEDESDIDLGPDDPSALLKTAKEKTLEAMEEDEGLPNSGVASLPFMSFEDIVKKLGPKTTHEVAIFASQFMAKEEKVARRLKSAVPPTQPRYGDDGDSDSGSEGQIVDGILSSGPRSTYELPSQEELIQRAFASDVEEEFEKDNEEVLNEENPEPEKPSLLPGWGSKTFARTLPFPFTSKEVFEQSIWMPIGLEFNPTTAIGALIRPEVVKKSGVIIKPIKQKDINPHERSEDRGKRKHKPPKSKTRSNSTISWKSK